MLHRFILKLVFLVPVLLLASCSEAQWMQQIAPAAQQELARKYIDLLREQQFDAIVAASDEEIAGPNLRPTLVEMAKLFPAGEPSMVTLVGAHKFTSGDATSLNLVYEYGYANKWLLSELTIRIRGARSTIVGFHVVPQPASLKEQHAFTLKGKDATQLMALALFVMMPLLVLYALVLCARAQFKGRKWPWVLFIVFGVGMFSVNWTTGQWNLNPFGIQLFSAAATAPSHGPWTFTLSLPLGAIIFLLWRKRLRVGQPERPA